GSNRGGLGPGALGLRRGVQAPPATRPYGNPFLRDGDVSRTAKRVGPGRGQMQRPSILASGTGSFGASVNGVTSGAGLRRSAARPSFSGNTAGLGTRQGLSPGGGNLGRGQAVGSGRGGVDAGPGLAGPGGRPAGGLGRGPDGGSNRGGLGTGRGPGSQVGQA